jgi:hypothetical protein
MKLRAPGAVPSGLPPRRAFVLQLADDAQPRTGALKGRAVHIHSGESAPFDDIDELLRFLDSQLAWVERADDSPTPHDDRPPTRKE